MSTSSPGPALSVHLALVVLLTMGVAAQKPATVPSTSGTAARTDTWLTDGEGRQYREEALPRAQGTRVGDAKVRTMWGVEVDLAREDDAAYYIKVYRVTAGPPPVTPAAVTTDAPADVEGLPAERSHLRFEDASAGLPTTGQWRDGLALFDLTGDGRLDIVSGPARKTLTRPAVFTRTADRWQSADVTFPSRPYDYGDVAIAQDGSTTVVAFGVHLRGLIALRGGGGSPIENASAGLPFATRADTEVFSSRAVALADCNGDGRLDLLAMGEGPRLMGATRDGTSSSGLATFVGQGNGTWQRTSTTPGQSEGIFGQSLVTGDIDGDGHIDAAYASGLLGDIALVFLGDGACGWGVEPVGQVRPRSYVTAVALGDVDGDKRADLVVGYTQFQGDGAIYGVDVLPRGADGGWHRRPLMRVTGRGRIEAVALGDLDGDGHRDIAAVGPGGVIQVFVGNGRGGFTRETTTVTSAEGCAGASLAIGDVDGDGRGDVVAGFSEERSPSAIDRCKGEGAVQVWLSRPRSN